MPIIVRTQKMTAHVSSTNDNAPCVILKVSGAAPATLPEQSNAERMHALFAGFSTAHGTHGVPELDANGLKWAIKGTARTLREPVTVALWVAHLQGKRPLGIIPVREDNSCSWGSIDDDDYRRDPLVIIAKIIAYGIPLVPCRSKSGGMHYFLFMKEPASAAAIQTRLREIAAVLGLAGCEIFPKQTHILAERGDVGNWMVMPYFGSTYNGKIHEQVGLNTNGSTMTIEEFIAKCEESKVGNLGDLAYITRPRTVRGIAVKKGAAATKGKTREFVAVPMRPGPLFAHADGQARTTNAPSTVVINAQQTTRAVVSSIADSNTATIMRDGPTKILSIQDELRELKSRLSLIDLIDCSMTLTRQGERCFALCPFHDERTPSFHVRPDYYHCFGCGAHGDHVDWLMQQEHMTFGEAVRQLREWTGTAHIQRAAVNDNQGRALAIWEEARPITGTLAARYLASRSINMTEVPTEALRFHPNCPFGKGTRPPCLVALFRNIITNEPSGIHRTALTPDGKKIERMSLGPIRGAAIKLWPDEAVTSGLVIGEGIETTLGAATRIEYRGARLQPAWAMGSTVNLAGLQVLEGIEALTILVDNDTAGRNAAVDVGRRWRAAGREVTALIPDSAGTDFNDVARADAA